MSLIDKLLARSVQPEPTKRKVIVRVLLDDAGRVQDVILKRSCGNAVQDSRALNDIRNMKFARGQIGAKTSRRWHEMAYSVE